MTQPPKEKTYRELLEGLDKISELNKLVGRGSGDLEDACYICGISPSTLKQAIQEHIEGLKYLKASEVLNEYLDGRDSNDQKVYMDGYLEWLKAQLKQLKDKGESK